MEFDSTHKRDTAVDEPDTYIFNGYETKRDAAEEEPDTYIFNGYE